MKTSYDPGTDSLYIKVRPLPSKRAVEVEADVMVDYGEDGGPVGYDIQHASSKTELIGRLKLFLRSQSESGRGNWVDCRRSLFCSISSRNS